MKKTVWLLLALSLSPNALACVDLLPIGVRFKSPYVPYVWAYWAILAAIPPVFYLSGFRFKKVSNPSVKAAHVCTIILIVLEFLSLQLDDTLGGIIGNFLFVIPNIILLIFSGISEIIGLVIGGIIIYMLIYQICKMLSCYHVVRRRQISDKTDEALPEESSKDQ